MSREPSFHTRAVRPFVVNEATTRDSDWYPDLEPARYDRDPDTVFEAAIRAIESRTRWRIVDRGGARRRIDAEVRSRVFGFVDDLRVDVEAGEPGAVVHVRSRSRAGVADFGTNARTIRELFERLAAELEADE